MKKWIQSITTILVLSAIIHVLVVMVIPSFVMAIALRRIEQTALKEVKQADIDQKAFRVVNTIVHAPRRTAETREVVAPNPDLLFSVILYDVSERPLFIEAVVPDTYWSISFYGSNTDNFYVKNEQQVHADSLKILLVGKHMSYSNPQNAEVVIATSKKGIVLFRALIKNDKQLKVLNRLRRKTVVKPMVLISDSQI